MSTPAETHTMGESLEAEVKRLTAVNASLLAELRKVEWSKPPGVSVSPRCPSCKRYRPDHLLACTLAAAIDKATRGEEEGS